MPKERKPFLPREEKEKRRCDICYKFLSSVNSGKTCFKHDVPPDQKPEIDTSCSSYCGQAFRRTLGEYEGYARLRL